MKRLLILTSVLLLAGCPVLLADGFRHPAPEIEAITMASPLPTFYYAANYQRAAVGYWTRAISARPVRTISTS